jgi:hypothetical protein
LQRDRQRNRQTDRPKTIPGYAPDLLIRGNKNKILNVLKNDWVRTDLYLALQCKIYDTNFDAPDVYFENSMSLRWWFGWKFGYLNSYTCKDPKNSKQNANGRIELNVSMKTMGLSDMTLKIEVPCLVLTFTIIFFPSCIAT